MNPVDHLDADRQEANDAFDEEWGRLRAEREAELSSLRARIAALQQQCDDADLLLGNGWKDVVAIATGAAGVEAALRAHVAKLAGDVAVLLEQIATLSAALRDAASKCHQCGGSGGWPDHEYNTVPCDWCTSWWRALEGKNAPAN